MHNIDFLDYDPQFDKHQSECRECLQKEQVFDSGNEYLQEIIDQLYSKEPLDKSKLEHCLDELCFLLKVKMKKTDLNIQRPEKQKDSFQSWIEFNNQYIKQMCAK